MAFLIAVFLFAIIAGALLLLSRLVEVNVSVEAETDILTLRVERPADLPFVMRLPGGELLYPDPDSIDDDVLMALQGTVSIALHGTGELRLTSPHPGRIEVKATAQASERADVVSQVRVFDETGEVHSSDESFFVAFDCAQMNCAGVREVSFLASVSGLRAGETFREWNQPDAPGPAPILQEKLEQGVVRAFTSTWRYQTRFELAHSDLAPGDVVETQDNRQIRGTVSINLDPEAAAGRIKLVAHTRTDKVQIERFGGGHSFGVPLSTLLMQQPYAQTAWLSFVSFFLVLGTLASFAIFLASMRKEDAGDSNQEP